MKTISLTIKKATLLQSKTYLIYLFYMLVFSVDLYFRCFGTGDWMD